MIVIELLIKGYIFLASAVIFNYWLGIFKIKNWYYLLTNFKNPKLKYIDILFLFIVYPLFLGLMVFILNF
jgi:hypothetical protein